ncbi:unnamed protein product [Caenorhabditis bovis]|uniref:Signal transducer and activator of transcription n=1 Tax=Caenorhabditis bovis TaxID=2654633 RepID=A0A8S1F269_9PELO|nr:unnamed protein product [Caenorhabditis bovis]
MGSNVPELQAALGEGTKMIHQLWEENKDLQGRFVNDLAELQRAQTLIAQYESEGRSDQVRHARSQLTEMQRHASALYEMLIVKRAEIFKKISEGANIMSILQEQLVNERLYDWKNRQKLAQIGMPFEEKDQILDQLQLEFEFLAEQNWQLHTFTCWMLDLLRRGPQLNDNNAQSAISNLSNLMNQLSKCLFCLVSQSFVVSVQPEPVLKTQHKFVTEVRLLIGDKLGIRQHLVKSSVIVKIISEDEAKQLSAGKFNHLEIKPVGTISNDYEKIVMDERGHMSGKFNNSKLTRIAHRKPPPKGSSDAKSAQCMQAATDQKYALLFHIDEFQLGNLGKFDVWALSLPIMVTVHGSQDCDAQVAILWHRAFAPVARTPSQTEVSAVSWNDLAIMLRNKFALFTGARRQLSDSDLKYLSEKLVVSDGQDQKPITFTQFAKQALREDVQFSFWEWFFSIMQLIKQKLLKFWDEGWLVGFISKHDASVIMVNNRRPCFLIRFSDSQTGAISIGFLADEDPFHLAPFSIKDLDQLSLASRIASCPQLRDIQYLYPNIDKDEMLRHFDTEERHRRPPDSPTGYIQSEIVMVAKTCGRASNAPSMFGTDSPEPLSIQSKSEWSPGEVPNGNPMDLSESLCFKSDDISAMLLASGIDPMPAADSVESLLGPSFKPFIPGRDGNLQFSDMNCQEMMNPHEQFFQ